MAHLLIVGEFPSREDIAAGAPFAGPSGHLLRQLLAEAGLTPADYTLTYALSERPYGGDPAAFFPRRKTPDSVFVGGRHCLPVVLEGLNQLQQTVTSCSPTTLLALGDTALWALTGNTGISKWRGSELHSTDYDLRVIPTYHPSSVLREWSLRPLVLHDIRKAANPAPAKPTYHFTLRPTYDDVLRFLTSALDSMDLGYPLKMSVDIETRNKHILCLGIAISRHTALCIPFTYGDMTPYWTEPQEIAITQLLRAVLTHKKALIIGQNFYYDAQYIAARLHFLPAVHFDTMIAQSVAYPGMQKSLHFLSSLYCEHHVYWKDDGRNWDPRTGNEDQLWYYNCEDCARTFEIYEVLSGVIVDRDVAAPFAFQTSLYLPLMRMMIRGIRFDEANRDRVSEGLDLQRKEILSRIHFIAGHPLNPQSPSQLKKFFYLDMDISPIHDRITSKLSLSQAVLHRIMKREPLLLPLIELILQYRQLTVLKSTFIDVQLSEDGRIRCSFNPAGTETFRFSSSADAFDAGTNLQNVPTPKLTG